MLALPLGALAACAPKTNDPADIQAVKQTVEAFGRAMNAGDTAGMAAMMTAEGALDGAHQGPRELDAALDCGDGERPG